MARPDSMHDDQPATMGDMTVVEDLFRKQGEAMQAMFSAFLPTAETPPPDQIGRAHV